MKTTRISLLALALLTVALVVGACSTSGTLQVPVVQTVVVPQTVQATSAAPQGQATSAAPQGQTAPVDQARAQTLNIAWGGPLSDPDNINPYTNWTRDTGMHNL